MDNFHYELADDTWSREEIEAILKVITSRRFTMGEKTREFEKMFAKYFGSKYAIMVNSGSSANLLAIAALVYSGRLKRGDEVIVPAVSWSTTYSPLHHFNLKLKFVDINLETLNIDIDKLKKAITKNTKAIFAVNLLGNPNDFDKLIQICKKNNLILIEDNCESMGATYNKRYTGTFGTLGTFSMFYSHHISTMEGGMVLTDDEELYHYMLAIRAHGWTRNLPKQSKIYSKRDDEFYELFNFVVPGFNLRPLEIEAAIGIEQLKKLDKFIENRRKNAEFFIKKMKNLKNFLTQKEIGKSSWFGFSLVLKDKLKGKRKEIINKLKKHNVETRPIVAGNFVKNKAIGFMNYEIFDSLDNADYIHENGFFIGNHSEIDLTRLETIYNILKNIDAKL